MKFYDRENEINILIATHSPFVLSDVPLSNTLYLDEGKVSEKKKETFCGNVHEMLGGNFFLDYSIGDVARKNVEDIIKLYNSRSDKGREPQNRQYYLTERSRLQYVAEHFADDYLRKTVNEMMDELAAMYEGEQSLDEKIAKAKKELESLLKQKEAGTYD